MANQKKATKRQPARQRTTGRRKAAINHSFITSTPVKKRPQPRPKIRKSTPVSDVHEHSGEVSLEDLAADIENSITTFHPDEMEDEEEKEDEDEDEDELREYK